MKRRVFPVAIMAIIMLFSSVLFYTAGCTGLPLTEPLPGNDVTVTSSEIMGHVHSVVVRYVDMTKFPEFVTYATTRGGPGYHSHSVSLTRDDFVLLAEVREITIKSGVAMEYDHYHEFVIKLPAR
jgi:hypothetical protein